MSMYGGQCSVCGQSVADPNLYDVPELGRAFLLGTRSGSTAAKVSILTALGQPTRDPHNAPALLSRHTNRKPHRPVLALIRHPHDRMASTWRKLVREQFWPHFACHGIRHGDDFPTFCRKVAELDPLNTDLHLRPLAPLVAAYADDVLRYEHLDQWAAKTGLPELRRTNASKPEPIPDFEAGCKAISRYFAADLALFR